MPDVSVLTPSFGYGRFIHDTLTSVSRQRGVSSEHIVQDGGSSDETIEILRGFGNGISWNSEPDRGQSDALNRAYARSSGTWIGWLNADEFYLPGALDVLVSEGERAGADVVYAESVWVTEHGRLIRLFPMHGFSRYLLKNYGCYIGSCAAVFRRTALGSSPWDENINSVLDWELYLRLAAAGAQFHQVTYPAAAYRVHADQISVQPQERYRRDHETMRKRHGMPSRNPRHASLLHAGYKLVSGAYDRQVKARRMRGADMRWFDDEVGLGPIRELMRRCYRSDV
jgi:glycosyltransferase involved in cell wall biosynthesis